MHRRFASMGAPRPWLAAVVAVLALGAGAAVAGSAAGGAEGEVLQALHLRGLTARPAALLMSGQAGGAVPLAVLALPVPLGAKQTAQPAGEKTGVAVIVEMGLAALSAAGEGELRSEVYVYATDAAGAPRGALTQTFTVPAARLSGEGAAAAVRFLGHLELPPGSYDLRVLVVGRMPEVFGLHRSALQVPDFSGEAPILLPPLVPNVSEAGWLRVREAPHGMLRGDPVKPLGLTSWPPARPVLPEDWEGELLVLGKRMGPLPGDLAGRLQSDAESSMGRSSLVSATHTPPVGGLERWRLEVRLEPSADGPARWLWETSVDGAAAPPPREIWVAGTKAAGDPMTQEPWPALQPSGLRAASPAAGRREASSSVPREAPPKLEEKELAEVAKRYPGILLQVAQGRRSQAMGELAELESEIVTGRSLPAVEALRQVELKVLAGVAGQEPESLVPVVWLYLDLFERYVRDRQLLLAAHARILVRQLTDLYLASAPGEASRRLAADLLTAYAGSLQILSLTTESESALKQAVTLTPGHRVALLGLAASHEGARQDEAAMGYLEALLEVLPEDAEACARLGRIQLRKARKSQAEATLRRCVEKTSPGWAVAVAYEELALLLGRSNRWPEAAALLEAAAKRLPDQPRIVLLLAYALDRVDQPAAGRRALVGLEVSGAAASPRARYGRWPRELFDGFRRDLEPEVERRRQVLGRALGEEAS